MNKGLVAVTLVVLIAAAAYFSVQETQTSTFEQWKVKYGSNWDNSEEYYRRAIFEKTLQEVERHNADATQTYKKALNQFSALTQDEFVAIYASGVIIPEEIKPVLE